MVSPAITIVSCRGIGVQQEEPQSKTDDPLSDIPGSVQRNFEAEEDFPHSLLDR